MAFQFLFQGFLIGIGVSIPLGPIGILCINRTLKQGLRRGMVSGLGAAVADTFYAVIAAFGVTAISDFLADHQTLIRAVGGAYLIYLGLRYFVTGPRAMLNNFRRPNHGHWASDFASIFALTLSNPLTIVVFGALFAGLGILQDDTPSWLMAAMSLGVLAGASAWWFAVTFLVNRMRSRISLRTLFWVNKFMGVAIAALGVVVLASAFF